MQSWKTPVVALLAVAVALCAALAFESVYHISSRVRPADVLRPRTTATDGTRASSSSPAFSLRLVDTGGVGVPLGGTWGGDYSHDLRVFRDAILEKPPYIDAEAFARIEQDWHAYVERMLAYGNNAIAVPLLLELIDFDHLGSDASSGGVYDTDSPFRARHAAVRRYFGPLFEWTRRRGMQVFLTTDMLALTPPLWEHLHRLAPAPGAVGIDAGDPAVWKVYRAGLEELFQTFPIDGVIVRFGEGGSLYNTTGWPYRSEMAIRSVASLRAMLHGLLPVFEAAHKTMVLRSWTVGVGHVGRLHIDPRVYEEALGDIDSPSLVVSTKLTAGDFFSYLPLNPTLLGGRHRRLVELQAKPEFEGFGAFPNFLGEEHARALRALRSANPRIAGTFLFTQFGGPLRAGPRTVYPLHGFWLWTDANVFVDSQLALDPDADVGALVKQWARATVGGDPRLVDAVVHVLAQSRQVVRNGFYIRSFAEREVRVPGLELPPLMWIFEWDMVGGWHSLLSIVYQTSRDAVDASIAEGHATAITVRLMREELQTAVAGSTGCGRMCADAVRSLEYEETLFDALAEWRQAFLSYYRWLDTGDAAAWDRWREGRARFVRAANGHVSSFGGDLDFPAFDLTSAMQTVRVAERGGWQRVVAGAALIGVVALLTIGGPVRRWLVENTRYRITFPRVARFARLVSVSATTPWRLRSERVDAASSICLAVCVLLLVGVLAGFFTGFTTVWTGAGSPLIVGLVVLAFASTTIRGQRREERSRLLASSLGPPLPGMVALLALMTYTGPLGFWYLFWTSSLFRVVLVTLLLGTMLWTAYIMFDVRTQEGWRGWAGGMLAAAGAGLLSLTALLPDWIHVLRSLDRPLNIAPATDTMLFALRAYAGVSLDISRSAYTIGVLLLASGYAIWFQSIVRATPRAPRHG